MHQMNRSLRFIRLTHTQLRRRAIRNHRATNTKEGWVRRCASEPKPTLTGSVAGILHGQGSRCAVSVSDIGDWNWFLFLVAGADYAGDCAWEMIPCFSQGD